MTHRVEHLRVIKQALDVRERDLEHQTDALSLKKLAEIANAKAFVYLEIGRVLSGGEVVRNYPGVSPDQRLQRQIAQHAIDHEAMVVAESNPRPTKRLRTQTLTNDQLAEDPATEASIFVGYWPEPVLSCAQCARRDPHTYLFCESPLLLGRERDAFIKQEPVAPPLSLCSWCALAKMNDEWSVNREWMCVDRCERDRWEPVPRPGGWNLACSVFRHTKMGLTFLLYRSGSQCILWAVNKAGKFMKDYTFAGGDTQAEAQKVASFLYVGRKF